MKFKKIILNNFRQYKGNIEIEFSVDPDKNITVVYGGITCGKTTLLQAFNWVLYGVANLQNKDKLLNFEVEESLVEVGQTAEVYVELYVENNNVEYKFKRVQNYACDMTGRTIPRGTYTKAEVLENDIWRQIGNYEEEIKKMLPYDLSTYFFFDGERMNAISEEQRKGSQEVAMSVKTILGLEHYSTAIKHLKTGRNSVLSELRSRLNTEANDKLTDLKRSLDRFENDITIKNDKIEEYKSEIEKLKSIKKAKEQLIADNKQTYQKQQEKLKKKNDLEKLIQKEEKLYDSYYKYFNNYYLDFFYFGLNEKLKKMDEVLSVETEGVPEMHSRSIKYILNRGYCLCGEKFENHENDHHYNALIAEMKKLPPQSIGTSIYNYKKQINNNIKESKANYFKEELLSKYTDVSDNNNNKYQLQDEIDKISVDIESNVDVGSLEREVRELEYRIDDYTNKKIRCEVDIEDIKNKIEDGNKEILRLSQYDTRNIEINKQMRLAERIAEILQNRYDKKEELLITVLESEINKYLSKIYEGKRFMKITRDYRFHLVYEDDTSAEDSVESEGLGTVKAISFMCGLLEVAKSQLLPEVSDETMYPLVFDAPLSKIDSVHRRNVMSSLPEIASQVIIFTREEKDLEDITAETREKINYSYNINKISEKCSEIITNKEV